MRVKIDESWGPTYQALATNFSEHLTDKQFNKLASCIDILHSEMQSKNIDIQKIQSSFGKIEKLKGKVDVRKIISPFVKKITADLKLLEDHKKHLDEIRDRNDSIKEQKYGILVKGNSAYVSFLNALLSLANETSTVLSQRAFTAAYPKMVEKLVNALKVAKLLDELDQMPEDPIKTDLLAAKENKKVIFNGENHLKTTVDWILILKGFSNKADKLLMPSEPEQTLNYLDLLSSTIKSCEEEKKQLEEVKPVLVDFQNEVEALVSYMTSVQTLMQQTLDSLTHKDKSEEIKDLYPKMVKTLAFLLEKNDLIKELESLEKNTIKTDIYIALKNGEVTFKYVDPNEWILVLIGCLNRKTVLLDKLNEKQSKSNANHDKDEMPPLEPVSQKVDLLADHISNLEITGNSNLNSHSVKKTGME